MKILFNPVEGADIKDIMYKDVLYFVSADDDIWLAGTVRQFEDEATGDFFKNLFGFLEEVSVDRAAKIIEETKNQYKCKEVGCTFVTNVPIKLAQHGKEHARNKKLNALGIPTVKSGGKTAEVKEEDAQKQIEAENRAAGLDQGTGLTQDLPTPAAIMS
jgi:hypothetical protein